MPAWMIRHFTIGLAVGTAMCAVLLWWLGDAVRPLLAEVARRPWQAPAIWAGVALPFATGYMGLALCLDTPGAARGGGRRMRNVQRGRIPAFAGAGRRGYDSRRRVLRFKT